MFGMLQQMSVHLIIQGRVYSNEWYDDEDELTEINGNPWEIIYPWSNNDKVVLNLKNGLLMVIIGLRYINAW